MSDTKVEFASAPWLDQARAVLEDLVADHGEDGRAFSVCETFTDAPGSVAESGTAAWNFYIDGKTVRVGRGTVDDADVKIQADYATALPAARLVYTPEVLAERAKQPPDESAPTPNVEGDMTNMPAYLIELHNRLAVITA
jgi:hypothetical protein